jgi:hypothetical protein
LRVEVLYLGREKNDRKIIKGELMRVQNFHTASGGNGSILFGKKQTMSWTTIYITGKTDFREEVRRKLEHSDQRYMPGFIESSGGEDTHDLYWLDGRTTLRSFKQAIGGKLIWKHRIRFYSTLESFLASQQARKDAEFSEREREMIAEMQESD